MPKALLLLYYILSQPTAMPSWEIFCDQFTWEGHLGLHLQIFLHGGHASPGSGQSGSPPSGQNLEQGT